jgi:hypothetical protein
LFFIAVLKVNDENSRFRSRICNKMSLIRNTVFLYRTLPLIRTYSFYFEKYLLRSERRAEDEVCVQICILYYILLYEDVRLATMRSILASGRQVSARQVSGRQVSGRQVSGRQVSGRQVSGRQVSGTMYGTCTRISSSTCTQISSSVPCSYHAYLN